MPVFAPVIAAEVFALRPDFRALSIHVEDITNVAATAATATALINASQSPCAEPWAEAHREAWREAYRSFGAKPQRTPCSAEALFKRLSRDGCVPPVNAVVDIYNAVSLRYAIPVGGENADAYAGMPRLMRATGKESFESMQQGAPVAECPDPGEVIWRDDLGATCRRWNWRQGTRTRIGNATSRMWFVLEALDPMPDAALIEAGGELIRSLSELSPACAIKSCLLAASGAAPISIGCFS